MAPTPGILYVTMEPKSTLTSAQFHDWYNNEHGPLRLRLPFVQNGFRYRATDLDGPGKGKHEWMAVYDLTDTVDLTREPYMKLRGPPVQSQRERDLRPHVDIDRRTFDLIRSWEAKDLKPLDDVKSTDGNVMVSVCFKLKPDATGEELDKWYNEEHIDMLMKVPGWRRSRRFVTSPIDGKSETEYLALHEYAPENGLGGKEFQAAVSTEWAKKIADEKVANRTRRVYDLYYTFGPAPRDISVLANGDLKVWDAQAIQTKTIPGPEGGAVESYVTTKDGVELPYRLEGSSDPNAPLIVLSNSILVDWHIWDDFIEAFFNHEQNKKYRVLRYLTRGRRSACGDQPITVDLLASDIIALLDALRVPQAAAAVGVSLGGATVLNVGLNYPDRVPRFMSCDTSAKSPAGNKKAWSDRIAVSEKEGAKSQSGEPIVGDELAEMTTRRWFVKESYNGGELEKKLEKVKAMVANNPLEGFKRSVQALWEYDMQPQLKGYSGKGAFLVGSGDGVLPNSMKEMAASLGNGADFTIVEGAGHLPMVEKPEEVAKAVTKLLSG
ncbi:hypothetical protein H2203_000597 [Taxawa tesnikishii (nom. ined.)]|nr:hypothetical protein H2203_000597 [Dothideales sp. JES 119]